MFGGIKLWACAGLLAATVAARAEAQTGMFGGTLYREWDLAARTSHGIADSARAYFMLYRDVKSGFVPTNLRLWWVGSSGRSYADAWARNATFGDQKYHAEFERTGAFRFAFDRDETPHLISTDARLPAGALASGDSLGLPATRPDTTTWKTSPLIGDVALRTRNTRTALQVTPRADLSVSAVWDHTGRRGQRPMGMAFGSPGGGLTGPAREILEPIDHTLDRFRIAPSITRAAWQAQVSWEYSSFHNAFASVRADNPYTAVNTATSGAAVGQGALAPDNEAQTFSASAGAKLAGSSRLTAAYTTSVRHQTAAFLPRTVNTALDTSLFGPMPATLDGYVRTTMANVGYTTRLHPKVTFATRFTYFNLGDRTPDLIFKGRVSADRSVSTALFEREKHPYSRQSVVAELTWRALPNATLRLSDNWQQWNRDAQTREVQHTIEHQPKLSLTASPTAWLDVRTSYRTGRRYGDGYNPVTISQNPDLRRYDEADRALRRFDFDAQVTPIASTTVGFLYGTSRQRYDWSGYGLLKDDYDLMGVDVTWTPSARVSLTAGAMRTAYDQLLRSRYRAGVQTTNMTLDWMTDERDTVTSYDAAVNLVLIPRTLEASVSYSRVLGRTNLNNSNPYTPSGVDAATAANALVTPFPQIYYYLRPIAATMRYHMSQTLTVSARLSTEDFETSDFRNAGLLPMTGGNYYLGNSLQGYGARYFTLSVSYRPWVPGLRHAVM